MITHAELLKILTYNPDTGAFISGFTGKEIGNGARKSGYRRINIKGKKYRTGRVAFFYMKGRWPIPTVDHKNRVRDDDRWDNLREASYHEQSTNREISKIYKGRGVLTHGDGVYYRSDRKNCWRARTWESKDGKLVRVSIGNFVTEQEAVNAYTTHRKNL